MRTGQLFLIILVVTALFPAAAASARSVTVSGTILFDNREWHPDPARALQQGDAAVSRNVTVVLRTPLENPTVEAITNARGQFEVRLDNVWGGGNSRIFLDVVAATGVGSIRDGNVFPAASAPIYTTRFDLGEFRSDRRHIVALGDIVIASPGNGFIERLRWRGLADSGRLVRVSRLEATAHFLLERLRWGFEYSDPLTGEWIGPVAVHFKEIDFRPESGDYWWASYGGGVLKLSLEQNGGGHALSEKTVLHEYGHHVHHMVGDADSSADSDGHSARDRGHPGNAFTEGWANYFANAVLASVTGNPDPGNLEDLFERGIGNLEDYDHSEGAGKRYEGIVQAFLWDLHDGGNNPDEPFDQDADPQAVFRAMDASESDDRWWIIPIANIAIDLDAFIDNYGGDAQTLANLASYYGIWREDANEQWGPGDIDLWNDVPGRETPVTHDVGSLTYRLEGLLQKRQRDRYQLALSPAERNALSDVPVTVFVEVVDAGFKGNGAVEIAVESSATSESFRLDPGTRRAAHELGPFRVDHADLVIELRSSSTTTGEYSLRVQLEHGDFPHRPELAFGAAGGALHPGAGAIDVPSGEVHFLADLQLPPFGGADRFEMQLEESYFEDFDRVNTEVHRYAPRIQGDVLRLTDSLQLPRDSHRYFRLRVRNRSTGAVSGWSESVLVRTYPPPPAPVNLRTYFMSDAELAERHRRLAEREAAAAAANGDFDRAMRLEELERVAEQIEPGSDPEETGHWQLQFTDSRPPNHSGVEGRRYQWQVSFQGGGYQELATNRSDWLALARNLAPGHYRFRVRAFNHAGSSGFSNVVDLDIIAEVYIVQAVALTKSGTATSGWWMQPAWEGSEAPFHTYQLQEMYPVATKGVTRWENGALEKITSQRLDFSNRKPGRYYFRARAVTYDRIGPFGPTTRIDIADPSSGGYTYQKYTATKKK